MKTKTNKSITKEELKALEQEITERIDSSNIKDYLDAIASFKEHKYSILNILLAMLQLKRPPVLLGGFKKWLELGRVVAKGQKSVKIWAPRIRKIENDKTGEKENQVFGFFMVSVFDYTQTVPLPDYEGEVFTLPDVDLNIEAKFYVSDYDLEEISLALMPVFEYELAYDKLGEIYGYTDGKKIVLNSDINEAGKFSAFFHELAHYILHFEDRSKVPPKAMRELEAEGTAYLILKYLGIKSEASIDYMAYYASKDYTIIDSFKVIQKAYIKITESLENIVKPTQASM